MAKLNFLSSPSHHRRNARRSLFGPISVDDRAKIDQWLENRSNEISAENLEKSNFYGFDFVNGVPLPDDHAGDYQWTACSSLEVPTFYLSKDGGVASQVTTFVPPKNIQPAVVTASTSSVVPTTTSFAIADQRPDLLKSLPKDYGGDSDMTTPLKPGDFATTTAQNMLTQSATTFFVPPPVPVKPKIKHQTQLSDFYGTKRSRKSLNSKFQQEQIAFSSSSTDESHSSSDHDEDDIMEEAGCCKISRLDLSLANTLKNKSA